MEEGLTCSRVQYRSLDLKLLMQSKQRLAFSLLVIGRALEEVQGRQIVIPDHLRNAPTKTHRAEGAAKGYKYPHDFPGHYVDQNYMPPGFEEAQFYHPTEQGQEGRLLERLKSLGRKRKYDKS